MNLWVDVALGNLQRRRGPPLDIDIETGEIKPAELFLCNGPCGRSLPETDFYMKFDKRTNSYRRQSPCKACISAGARKAASLRRKLKVTTKAKILAAAVNPSSLRAISEAICLSRRPTDEAIKKLMAEGLIRRAGYGSLGTNSKIPLYQTTQTHPGETA